jgi:alkylhydroperoxidase family enzyme
MTSMQRRLAEAVKEMTTSVLGENGRAPLALRVAALRGESVPAEIEPYVAKIRDASYRITDDDFAALTRAGLSEDEIFDITVAAAIGSAADSVEPALAILSR